MESFLGFEYNYLEQLFKTRKNLINTDKNALFLPKFCILLDYTFIGVIKFLKMKTTKLTSRKKHLRGLKYRSSAPIFSPKPKQLLSEENSTKVFGGKFLVQGQEGALLPWQNVVRTVRGDVVIENSYVAVFPNLEIVSGNLILRNSKVKYFDGLTFLGGNLVLENSEILSMEKLAYIGGNVKLQGSKVLWFNALENIAGNVVMEDAYISKLPALKNVYGKVKMKESEVDLCSENVKPKFLPKQSKKENEK